MICNGNIALISVLYKINNGAIMVELLCSYLAL